jgi:hypothetical protein
MVKGLHGRPIFIVEEVIATSKINLCCMQFIGAALGG